MPQKYQINPYSPKKVNKEDLGMSMFYVCTIHWMRERVKWHSLTFNSWRITVYG